MESPIKKKKPDEGPRLQSTSRREKNRVKGIRKKKKKGVVQ